LTDAAGTREDAGRASRGRPRSEAADRAIFEAVIALIAGGESFANLSVEAIAARAGVGKATIYRRWPNKEALLLDAFGRNAPPLPEPPGRSLREDLILIAVCVAQSRSPGPERLFNARGYAALLTEGQRNPDFMRRYKTEVVEPRRRILQNVLRRAQERGELRKEADLELVHELLTSTIFMRLIRGQNVTRDYAERLVDTVLRGARA
jgi:AcrR family transcriptional regulator